MKVGPEPKLIEPFPLSSNCITVAAGAGLESPNASMAVDSTEAWKILNFTFLFPPLYVGIAVRYAAPAEARAAH
jgi:hypothetical protein